MSDRRTARRLRGRPRRATGAGCRDAIRWPISWPEHADAWRRLSVRNAELPGESRRQGRPVRLPLRGEPAADCIGPGPDRRRRHVRRADALRRRGLLAGVEGPERLGDGQRTHHGWDAGRHNCRLPLCPATDRTTKLGLDRARILPRQIPRSSRADRRSTGCTHPGATSSSGSQHECPLMRPRVRQDRVWRSPHHLTRLAHCNDVEIERAGGVALASAPCPARASIACSRASRAAGSGSSEAVLSPQKCDSR